MKNLHHNKTTGFIPKRLRNLNAKCNNINNSNIPSTTSRSHNDLFNHISSARDFLFLNSLRKEFEKPYIQPCGDDVIISEFEYEKGNDDEIKIEFNNKDENSKNLEPFDDKQNERESIEAEIHNYYCESRQDIVDISNINDKTNIIEGIMKKIEENTQIINNQTKIMIEEKKDQSTMAINLNINENTNNNENILPSRLSLEETTKIKYISNVKAKEQVKKTYLKKSTERACRVCLETEVKIETGELISPCKCIGTVKYIHDKCLKKWILAGKVPIDKARCELCHTTFLIEIEEKIKYCSRKKYTRKEYQTLCLIGILSIFLYVLLHLMAILIIQIQEDMSSNSGSTEKYFIFKWIVICVCSFFCSVLLFSLYYLVKKFCISQKSINWRILEYSEVSKKRLRKGKKLKKLILSLNSKNEEGLDIPVVAAVAAAGESG